MIAEVRPRVRDLDACRLLDSDALALLLETGKYAHISPVTPPWKSIQLSTRRPINIQ